MIKNLQILILLTIFLPFLNSCAGFNQTDAREFPPEPEKRVKKNLEEGRGFTMMDAFSDKGKGGSGNFDFASSNELWRASLDTLDFMPLALANYSGGIIVTDWYSDGKNVNESVKISIRFLSNEIRSNALSVKVFYKKCSIDQSCEISDRSSSLSTELAQKILSKAALYQKESNSKNKKKYINEALK